MDVHSSGRELRRARRDPRHVVGFAVGAACAAATALSAQVGPLGNRVIGDPGGAQALARWGTTSAVGDFENDGYDDLALGTPWRDDVDPPPTRADVGRVAIYRGSQGGLGALPQQQIGGPTTDLKTGYALAAGDFDGDGKDELAVARPGSQIGVGSAEQAGAVYVYIRTGGSWFEESVWYQGGGSIPAASEAFDQLGRSLAVGDFDDDGYDDLVIGIPGENLETPAPTLLDAGAIAVLYGSSTGLVATGAQLFDESTGLGGAQALAQFGAVLATGRFNDDSYDDLAIGVPLRDLGGAIDAGEVVVLFGGAAGLTTGGHQRLDDEDVGGTIAAGDRFGAALAAGRFRSTSPCSAATCLDQLAIGLPGEPGAAGEANAGGLVEVPGSTSGLDAFGARFYRQNDLDNLSTPEAGDRLGEVLAAGELDGRPGADLVVGVPSETWVSNAGQGTIHLVYGGPSGLAYSHPGQGFVQDGLASGPGIAGDRFGSSAAIGDFDAAGAGDLVVGVPGRDIGGAIDSGTAQLLRSGLFADSFESGDLLLWSSSSGRERTLVAPSAAPEEPLVPAP